MLKMMLRSVSRGAGVRALRSGSHTVDDIARTSLGKRRGRSFAFFRVVSAAFASEEHGSVAAAAAEKPAVVNPEPQVAAFNERLVNSVTVTGVVVSDPGERELQSGDIVVSMELAVPRERRSSAYEIEYDYVPVSFFGFAGQQAKEHLTKGAKVFVKGRLSKWKRAYRMSVTADDFGLVEEGTWPIDSAPAPRTEAEVSGKRTITKGYLTPSQQRVYDDYRSGKAVKQIAEQRNLKHATVLSYLAENALQGRPMDFPFLARSCLLGPKGSNHMEIDEVCVALRAVVDDQNLSSIEEIPITDVHVMLKAYKNGYPFQTQEKMITSVTYAQIVTVAAMMKQGLTPRDWNAFQSVSSNVQSSTAEDASADAGPPPY